MKIRNHCWHGFLCALLIGGVPAAASAGDSLLSFSKLATSDRIQVRWVSRGCFHYNVYEFTFQGGTPAKVVATSLLEDWLASKTGRFETIRKDLGQLTLTESDLRGLDGLLQYYRSDRRGGCTTVDDITLNLLRGGRILATGQFTDASCGTHDLPHVTTFGQLVQRLQDAALRNTN